MYNLCVHVVLCHADTDKLDENALFSILTHLSAVSDVLNCNIAQCEDIKVEIQQVLNYAKFYVSLYDLTI